MTSRAWTVGSNGLFKYTAIRQHHLNDILNVMQNYFFKEELLSQIAGLNKSPEAVKELDQMVLDVLKDGVSLIATEEKTEKVVAVQLNKLMIKENQPQGYFNEPIHLNHPTARQFNRINAIIDRSVNCYEILKTNCYFEFMFGAVLPEFRRKNIPTKLVQLSIKTAQCLKDGKKVQVPFTENDPPVYGKPTGLIGICTSPITAKVLKRLDFTVATTIQLSDSLQTGSLAPIPIMYKFLK